MKKIDYFIWIKLEVTDYLLNEKRHRNTGKYVIDEEDKLSNIAEEDNVSIIGEEEMLVILVQKTKILIGRKIFLVVQNIGEQREIPVK